VSNHRLRAETAAGMNIKVQEVLTPKLDGSFTIFDTVTGIDSMDLWR
jgi:hypothetical protein